MPGLCKGLDRQTRSRKARRPGRHLYPYLVVDATYVDVRVSGTVVSQGVLIVVAILEDGKREVIDLMLADTESEPTYPESSKGLKNRGLSGG